VIATSDAGLCLFAGDGKGGLAAPATLPLPNLFQRFAAADFNRDGTLDLVVANSLGAPWLVSGLGKGKFAPPLPLPLTFGPSTLAAADLNADGKLDLVGSDGKFLWNAAGVGDGT